MQAYHFIKYNNETNIKHLNKLAETDVILCFDFEDSINTSEKQYYRNCFKHIIENIIPMMPEVKVGLRINNNALELAKDLEAISNQHINSIFFPKIEKFEQIENIQKLLSKREVFYNELIPIIETKNALSDLDAIINTSPPKIKRLGFGHCDYNLSIKAFPFFHQNSIEYWKWINKIRTIISPKGLTIVNSAYLELENHSFFQSMLHHLYEIFGDKVGQTALTSRQSELIKQFNPNHNHLSFNELINHRLDLRVPYQYDKQIIDYYERDKKDKAFSVLKKNNIMISPHEYLTAKAFYNEKKSTSVNLTFVGGCFPVQQSILFEDLFHQRLKRKIEITFNIEFNINIIRYERLNTCLGKIKKSNKSFPIDILVFHVRPEPFLRLVKFYYRFLNNKGKLKHSLNIPFLKILSPEKYDVLNFERRFNYEPTQKETSLHKALVDLNYKIGKLFGNKKYALWKYFELTSNIVEYCKASSINPIVLGSGSRNNTSYAPILCHQLNMYFESKFKNKDIPYIDGFDQYSENNDQYFQDDGIHASEKYHELIAEKLFNELKEELNRIAFPKAL